MRKLYKVEYNQQWKEFQVRNDHDSCSAAGEPYTPEYIYGFETREEAVACSEQLRKWHDHGSHPSYRKYVEKL